MSSVRNIVLSGTIAAIVAIGLIIAVVFIPGAGLGISSTTSAHLSTSSSIQTGSTSQSVSTSQGGPGTTEQSQQGTMAVLLTDPPTVPENVTAVYMQYSEVQAHIANAGNNTGWYDLDGSGVVNLMSVVNVSQTIASQNLPSGRFNGLRFNATSVVVTYEGTNYTALFISGHDTLYVWIPGGINVTAAQTTSALIDLTPTVLLAGNSSSPTFIFVPAAAGYVFPSASIPAESHVIGARVNLSNNSFWLNIRHKIKFAITSISLTPTSLSITVVNQGTASFVMRLAAITTQSTLSGGMEGQLRTGDIFVIENNGTLVTLNATNWSTVANQVAAAGLLLAPGQSIVLHYSGAPIEIGMQMGMHFNNLAMTTPIKVGSTYHVWVQGSDQIASGAVTAG